MTAKWVREGKSCEVVIANYSMRSDSSKLLADFDQYCDQLEAIGMAECLEMITG